jgi:hypothetical protein
MTEHNSTFPPFTIRQVLNLCWGLTLYYSHQEDQRQIAELFMGDRFGGEMKKIFDSYSNYKNSHSQEQKSSSQVKSSTKKIDLPFNEALREKQFTENVMMAMIKTLRNLGLARDAYVNWLNYKANEIEEEREYLNEVSSFSSFTPDGLIPKIIPFIGGGSALSWASIWASIDAIRGDLKAITAVSSNATNPAVSDQLTNLLNYVSGLSTPSFIFIFLAAGVLALTISTIIAKIWKKYRLDSMRRDFESKVKEHWRRTARPSMADCLFDLYKDLRFTMRRFYLDYKEDCFITPYDYPWARNRDDRNARAIIESEIIQPESVEPPDVPVMITKKVLTQENINAPQPTQAAANEANSTRENEELKAQVEELKEKIADREGAGPSEPGVEADLE